MKKIRIPGTELELSPLGMGCENAGLKWEGKDAEYLFDAFLDIGGNVYDTARVYSDWIPPETGRSERVLGEWIAAGKKRDQMVLITKGGHPDITGLRPDIHKSRMSEEDMRHDLELSLKTLRTDYIDLYFYHRDDKTIPVETLIETMQQFVKEGKIRYYACSNWSSDRIREADTYCRKQGYRSFAANQVLYNLGSQFMKPLADDTLAYMDEEMKEYHRGNPPNLAMPYMGICNGFFHNFVEKGAHAVEESPYYTEGNIRLANQVKILMEKYNATVMQVVLGFFTCQDFQCLPLYGPRNVENLKEAMRTFDIPFEKTDYKAEE